MLAISQALIAIAIVLSLMVALLFWAKEMDDWSDR